MLTPSAVTNAKGQPKPYKLRDERAMYLLVRPDGARWWRFDYRRPGTGKRNTLSLGTFPDVSLKQTRQRRDDARKLIADGIDTAHRAHQNCEQVFRYAVATGRAQGDVTRDLRGSLTPATAGHFASITGPDKVGELLRAIDGFTGTYSVACALKLAPLVFVRPGELRRAEWQEIDLDAAEWNIPADKMKMGQPYLVPLSSQAVAILRDLQPLTGSGRYVFPGARDRKKPLSNMALNAAFKRMGYDGQTFTAHGFRAMARTILDEGLGFRPDFIEHQLAHAVKDPNGCAYNRTAHLPERRKMMQAWADYLDVLRQDHGKVVPLYKAKV